MIYCKYCGAAIVASKYATSGWVHVGTLTSMCTPVRYATPTELTRDTSTR